MEGEKGRKKEFGLLIKYGLAERSGCESAFVRGGANCKKVGRSGRWEESMIARRRRRTGRLFTVFYSSLTVDTGVAKD